MSYWGDTSISKLRRRLSVFVGTLLTACSTIPGIAALPGSSSSMATDLPRLEAQVLSELNSVRTNPAAYAANLSPLLTMFTGTVLQRPGWSFPVQTNEGAAAVREAIDALAKQPAVPRLTLDPALSTAARDLANDQSRTGAVGHTSSDGASPADRISRYGTWAISYGENVDYGAVTSGRDVVEDMLIDDGVPSRGHRINTFDASARVLGVGCAPHPKYGLVCVIDQAGSFVPR